MSIVQLAGHRPEPDRRGFTLIELLVVIAVIAVLAAILFPVFAQAREKARQTGCASNTRQLALGILMYAENFDETLPPVAFAPEDEAQGEAENDRVVLWAELIAPYVRNRQVQLCPSDAKSSRISYGLNELVFADLADPGALRVPVRTLATIQNPAATVMLGDSGTANDFRAPLADSYKMVAPSYPLNDDADARPAARHQERVNISFLDGHQRSFRLEQFYTNQTPPDHWFLP